MKAAFYEIEPWQAEYLKARLGGIELSFYPDNFSQNALPEPDADIFSGFIDSKVTAEIVTGSKSLKFIATRTTGFDHIDLEACRKRGIPVSNVPSYGENTVAEHTFALLLGLSRKLYPSIKRVREEALFNFEGLEGFDLKGKTLGVVGTGHIGAYVVRIAQGFGMHVVAYDPYPSERLMADLNLKYYTLEKLLSISDIVTLHVPYMPQTHHLLNSAAFAAMKPGVILLNTARGGLVDTDSLVESLRNGRLAGAGLDVLEEEGFVRDELDLLHAGHPSEAQLKTVLIDHELMRMENVLVTPHNAFNTKEALQRILDTTIANIHAFVQGNPINIVQA